jgi:Secretion system C-terminal sorting domain
MKKTLLFISALIAGANGFAQDIPNGNFETWTTATKAANWSEIVTYDVTGSIAVVVPLSATNASAAGKSYIGDSAIVVHSVSASGNWVPGISVSGDNSGMIIHATVTGFPPTVVGTPTTERWGSIPMTTIPKTLSGFARYRTTPGTAQKGAIAIEVFRAGVVVAGYSGTQFNIDTVAANAGYKNFNIPITKLSANGPDNCDSVRISLISAAVTSATISAKDTLWVDGLRFLSCTPNAASTLATAGLKSDDNNAGLAGEAVLSLTPGAAYNHTFTFSVPNPTVGQTSITQPIAADITYTLSPLDSVEFTDIDLTNAPGLTFTQGHPSGVAYANSLYCYSISGTIPATNNVKHVFSIAQTPYGQVTVGASGLNLGTTTAPIGTLVGTPAGDVPVDLNDLPVDSISICVGKGPGCINGIASLDSLSFAVSQNRPNPFNGTTTINFTSPKTGKVTFTVVNVLGQQVFSSSISATVGGNTFTFDGGSTEPGSYFFSLSNGTDTVTKKLVITGNN